MSGHPAAYAAAHEDADRNRRIESAMALMREYRRLHAWIVSCGSPLRDGLINAACAVFVCVFSDIVRPARAHALGESLTDATVVPQAGELASLPDPSGELRRKLASRVLATFVSGTASFAAVAPGLIAELQQSMRTGTVCSAGWGCARAAACAPAFC